IKMNTVEIEYSPLLKFRAPPDRGQRWQLRFRGAIGRAHPNNHRSMFPCDRIQMIDGFEVTGNYLLAYLIDFLFNPIDSLLHLHCLLDCPIEPIDAGNIRAKIESQLRIVPQKTRDFDCVFVVDPERRLLRWAPVGYDLEPSAGSDRFGAGFDFG